MEFPNITPPVLEHFHAQCREGVTKHYLEYKITSQAPKLWLACVPYECSKSLERLKYHDIPFIPEWEKNSFRQRKLFYCQVGSMFAAEHLEVPLMAFTTYLGVSDKKEVLCCASSCVSGLATLFTSAVSRAGDVILLSPWETEPHAEPLHDPFLQAFYQGFWSVAEDRIKLWDSEHV